VQNIEDEIEAVNEEAEVEAVLGDEHAGVTDNGVVEVTEADCLRAEIEKLTAEANDAKDKYLRTAAEYDNFRKRSAKDRLTAIAQTRSADAADFISVSDNLYRAANADCSDANYKKGVGMIIGQFENVLKKLGVTEIEATGKPFDPNIHNAIGQREDENFPDNTVCEVVQKGYMLEDKMIRPALVIVANP
jgi:molecular chaperone GrpE